MQSLFSTGNVNQRPIVVIVTMLLAVLPYSANGAAFTFLDSGDLAISGEIRPGDYEEMIVAIKKSGSIPKAVQIWSPGGDVREAMRIGRFIRAALISVIIDAEAVCNSSCVLILVAGPIRMISTPIGIHRPYYDPEYFGDLSPIEAEEQYREMDRLVREYLADMNVPAPFVDRMMSVRSTDVMAVSREEFHNEVGLRTPAVEEWKIAKCGAMSDDERNDWGAVEMISFVEIIEEDMKTSTDPRNNEKNRQILEEILPRANYAKTLSKGYRDYLHRKNTEISRCERTAVNDHRKLMFDAL